MSKLALALTLLAFTAVFVSSQSDWDYIDCHNHGTYVPYVNPYTNSSNGFCNCTSGWTGVDCSVCTSTMSCGPSQDCVPGFGMSGFASKGFSCFSSSFLNTRNNSLTASFDGQGNGEFSVFATATGAPRVFVCRLSNCSSVDSNDGTSGIRCLQTTCNCTDACNSIQNGIAKGIRGISIWKCSSDGVCSWSNAPMVNGKFYCSAASCNPHSGTDSTVPGTVTGTTIPPGTTVTDTTIPPGTTVTDTTIPPGTTVTNTTIPPGTTASSTPTNTTFSGTTARPTTPGTASSTPTNTLFPGTTVHSTPGSTIPPTFGPCTTVPKDDCIAVCGVGHIKVCQCIHGEPYVECDVSSSAALMVSWMIALIAVLFA